MFDCVIMLYLMIQVIICYEETYGNFSNIDFDIFSLRANFLKIGFYGAIFEGIICGSLSQILRASVGDQGK